MADIQKVPLVKLVVGVIFSREDVLSRAKEKLKGKFGPIDFESRTIAFTFTDYYTEEMGQALSRKFFSFKKLINPAKLPKTKLYTNRLERSFTHKKKRLINLDPGYLHAAKLVLASCKDYSHRLYLGKGIHGEVTLHFQDEAFRFWPWTYPDYKTKTYLDVFLAIRKLYLKQVR